MSRNVSANRGEGAPGLWNIALRLAVDNPAKLSVLKLAQELESWLPPAIAWKMAQMGWYDREVAAAVFEPVRAQMEQADNEDLAAVANPLQGRLTPFLGWSIFDPRAAVARLEQVPATAGISARAVFNSRVQVAQILGLSYKDRWRRIWTDYTDMRFLLERDIQ